MAIDFTRLVGKNLETQSDEFCIHLAEFRALKA